MDTIPKNLWCPAGAARQARIACAVALLAALALTPAAAVACRPAVRDTPSPGSPRDARQADHGALPGPLRLRDGFLLHSGFLLATPSPARLLPPGERQLDFELAVANTFTRSNTVHVALETRAARGAVDAEFFRQVAAESPGAEPLFLLDGEVQRAELRVRQGFAHGVEAELTLALLNVQGGRLDRLAEGFHGLLRIDQDGRDHVTRGGYFVYLDLAGGVVLREAAPGATLGDAAVTVRKAFTSLLPPTSWRPAVERTLLLEGSVKVPSGDEAGLVSSGSVDFGLQGMISACGWYFCGYGGVGVRRLGAWRVLGLGAQTVVDGVTAVERRYAGGVSLIYQISASQSPLADLGLANLAEDSYRFSFGVKHAIDARRSVVLSVTENFAHFDNGSDITFHFGWTQGLPGGSLLSGAARGR